MFLQLPSSKSISNRLVVISALTDKGMRIDNLSESDDTQTLRACLNSDLRHCDAGLSGTAARFMAAYLSLRPGLHVLTGSGRMLQRPMSPLVEALRQLGAQIEATGPQAHLPLRIQGGTLHGGTIHIDSRQSSQFVSALMLIAPCLDEPLQIMLDAPVPSMDYIRLTGHIMQQQGADVSIGQDCITVQPARYKPSDTQVEADWSAAGYWYEWIALHGTQPLLLRGLRLESMQSERLSESVFRRLGVCSEAMPDGVRICRQRTTLPDTVIEADCSSMPDSTLAIVGACCGMNRPFRLSGVQNLRFKESDRIDAMIHEYQSLGYSLYTMNHTLCYDGGKQTPEHQQTISTHDDHRIAMSIAPLLGSRASLMMDDARVVSKSYPTFWSDFRAVCASSDHQEA
ncbi:MAG: 3-phosphoshikimate 1-carboxyvinyltransferase [Paludibacteraceae bacterium]|nr:3-phosphoshikimate 1-carboxyvinyltransferase [Paludibacteraceae bacterium]